MQKYELTPNIPIVGSRGAKIAKKLLGTATEKVAITDRLSSYNWIVRRQFCWAHLRRDFQAMCDRGGAAAKIGESLLERSKHLFEWWHRVRDGTLSRSTFQRYAGWLRSAVREDLLRGTRCACPKTAATCRELLEDEDHLWTFVSVEGVEPTNNHSARALRHGVIYRKLSGGTKSESGSRFIERILSVIATCRQQEINVLEYLTACYQAHLDRQPAPSLVPSESTAPVS